MMIWAGADAPAMDARLKPGHDGGGSRAGSTEGDGSREPRHHPRMGGWVYILASKAGGTLYVGVTNDIIRRVFEHRTGAVPGFTKRYGVKDLVYFECHDTITAAIQREKNIKHWPRDWKIDLIVSMNPDWRDLYEEIAQ